MKFRKSLHHRPLPKTTKIKFSDKEIQQQLAKIDSNEVFISEPMGIILLNRPKHKSYEKTFTKHADRLDLSSRGLDTLDDLEENFFKKNIVQKQIPKKRKKFDQIFLNTVPLTPFVQTSSNGMKPKRTKPLTTALAPRISINQNLPSQPIATPSSAQITAARKKSLFNRPDLESFMVEPVKQKNKVLLFKYQLGKFLGQGTYGKVYQCVDIETKKMYAQKQFIKGDVRIKKYINKEIAIMKQLSHDNIVKYVQNYELPKSQYIVMEYCGTTNLKAYVKQRVFLTQNQAKPLFETLVNCIKYLHEKLIVHRDLKLQNALINEQGKLKLIDFGFSDQLQNLNSPLSNYCGTPTYMCPEIIRKTPYNGFKADCWALGIILYYMLVGSFPFVCKTQKELFPTILKTPIPIDNRFSATLRHLLRGMLDPDKDERFDIYDICSHEWFM